MLAGARSRGHAAPSAERPLRISGHAALFVVMYCYSMLPGAATARALVVELAWSVTSVLDTRVRRLWRLGGCAEPGLEPEA